MSPPALEASWLWIKRRLACNTLRVLLLRSNEGKLMFGRTAAKVDTYDAIGSRECVIAMNHAEVNEPAPASDRSWWWWHSRSAAECPNRLCVGKLVHFRFQYLFFMSGEMIMWLFRYRKLGFSFQSVSILSRFQLCELNREMDTMYHLSAGIGWFNWPQWLSELLHLSKQVATQIWMLSLFCSSYILHSASETDTSHTSRTFSKRTKLLARDQLIQNAKVASQEHDHLDDGTTNENDRRPKFVSFCHFVDTVFAGGKQWISI